jgi:hypothetical protein
MSSAAMNLELQQSAVKQHCKALRMPTVAAQFSTMVEQALAGGDLMLTQAVESYLGVRRAMGFALHSEGSLLQSAPGRSVIV